MREQQDLPFSVPLAILTGCLKRLSRLDTRMSCEQVSRINRLLKTLTLATELEIGSSLSGLGVSAGASVGGGLKRGADVPLVWRGHFRARDAIN